MARVPHGSGLFLFLASFLLIAQHWEVVEEYAAPSSASNGLTWDGQYLWHSHDNSGQIYKIDPSNGKVIASITAQVPNPGDIAWHNGFIWMVAENERKLYKINPGDGAIVNSILISEMLGPSDMEGVTTDGKYLWTANSGGKFCQVDPDAGTVLFCMQTDLWSDGLAWAYGSIWTSTNRSTIVELSACTGERREMFVAPGNGFDAEGLAFDGDNLWFADNSTDRIYKITLLDDYRTKTTRTTVVCGAQELPQNRTFKPGAENVYKGLWIASKSHGLVFGLPEKTNQAEVSIFNIRGEKIDSKILAPVSTDRSLFSWDSESVSAGAVFILRIETRTKVYYSKWTAL